LLLPPGFWHCAFPVPVAAIVTKTSPSAEPGELTT
jgi:hypothetical protein